jgi:hypothetical protein
MTTIIKKQDYIATLKALKYLLTQLKIDLVENAEMGMTKEDIEGHCIPTVFERVDVIYDVKKALAPFINNKIVYASVPHKLLFKRHHITGRCFMTYSVFSDEEMQPPEPQFASNAMEVPSVSKILTEPFCLLGGRRKFLKRLGIESIVVDITDEQCDRLAIFKQLEKAKVFDDLQKASINANEKLTSIEDSVEDDDSAKEVTETDEKPGAGLIEWLKTISLKELETLVVPPMIPGVNDPMVDEVDDDEIDLGAVGKNKKKLSGPGGAEAPVRLLRQATVH